MIAQGSEGGRATTTEPRADPGKWPAIGAGRTAPAPYDGNPLH